MRMVDAGSSLCSQALDSPLTAYPGCIGNYSFREALPFCNTKRRCRERLSIALTIIARNFADAISRIDFDNTSQIATWLSAADKTGCSLHFKDGVGLSRPLLSTIDVARHTLIRHHKHQF